MASTPPGLPCTPPGINPRLTHNWPKLDLKCGLQRLIMTLRDDSTSRDAHQISGLPWLETRSCQQAAMTHVAQESLACSRSGSLPSDRLRAGKDRQAWNASLWWNDRLESGASGVAKEGGRSRASPLARGHPRGKCPQKENRGPKARMSFGVNVIGQSGGARPKPECPLE